MVLASELLPIGETPMHVILNGMGVLLDTFIRWGWAPNAIYVHHETAKTVFDQLTQMLGIKLKVTSQLPMLDEALACLLARFGGGWADDFNDDESDNAPPVRHRGRR